jgi:hypothetical protein
VSWDRVFGCCVATVARTTITSTKKIIRKLFPLIERLRIVELIDLMNMLKRKRFLHLSSSLPLFLSSLTLRLPVLQLNLLKQKRDVLHKLVTIQRSALDGTLPSSNSLPHMKSHSRQWDSMSVASSRSNTSRRSSASYASFNPPAPTNYKQPKLMVPKLQL